MQKPDRTELLRDLHHVVNSPLSSIFNLTEMILLGIEGEMSVEVRQDVQTIADDAHRLHHALEGILEFIRTVTTNYSVQLVDVNELLKAIANHFDSSLTVHLPTISQPLMVIGNEDALKLILQKLVAYSIRATAGQIPVINVQLNDKAIQFSISLEGNIDSRNVRREFSSSLDLLLCELLLRLQGGALWFDASVPHRKIVCFSVQKSV